MTLLREYLTALRRLLDGDEVTVDGRYVKLHGVRLDWPPAPGFELLCAATGPKTLRLSGELASGTVITGGTTPQALRAAVDTIGRTPHSVITYLQCALGPDARARALHQLEEGEFKGALDDLAAYGTPAETAQSARRWVEAGADTVVFQPGADTDVTEFVTIIGSRVQPLLAT